jgi:hypothetical protein
LREFRFHQRAQRGEIRLAERALDDPTAPIDEEGRGGQLHVAEALRDLALWIERTTLPRRPAVVSFSPVNVLKLTSGAGAGWLQTR